MSADNRSVHTDALRTLGTVLDPTDAGNKRDAIHLAVEPAIAGVHLSPGNPIELRDGVAVHSPRECATGIVDPFIEQAVIKPGDKFWFILMPRTVTSLRHVWSHPAFEDVQ